ncbi:MAG: aquaporin [Nitrospiraceae bacterium]
MNPARAFGTATAIFHFPLEHIVYWIGPIIGGIVAGLVYGYGLLKKD